MVNRMHIKVNLDIKTNYWSPGLPLINDPKYGLNDLTQEEKLQIQSDFTKFLVKQLKKLLKRRIKTQYQYLRWAPLTPEYAEFKRRTGLSENIWEATGLLVDSISYKRVSDYYIVGIDPNKMYPGTHTKVLFIAKCMEFGTRYMPARPLFGPTVYFMRRHIRSYWELFLEESIKEEWYS